MTTTTPLIDMKHEDTFSKAHNNISALTNFFKERFLKKGLSSKRFSQ